MRACTKQTTTTTPTVNECDIEMIFAISIAPCTAAHQITNKQQNMLMCEEWTEAISIQIDMNLVGMCNADMCHQTCDSIVLTVIVLFYYWMVMIFKIFRTVWNVGCDFILLVSRTCRVPPIRFRIHVEYNVFDRQENINENGNRADEHDRCSRGGRSSMPGPVRSEWALKCDTLYVRH